MSGRRISTLIRITLGTALLVCLFLLPQVLRAQVLVDLSIKRTLYIAYEPLLATVRVSNLSGNTLLLADVEGKKWFGFQIETLDGRPIPPRDPNYEIQPIKLASGESITRTVNLTQLYPLSDFGSYRIRASVYAAELSRYFSSPPLTVEINEGRLLWEQTVGVPGTEGLRNSTRTISLLSERFADRTDLYLRIQDKEAGVVYCTHRLGDYITFGKPEIMLDSSNTIHVLQNNIPRQFIYSKVGLDGKILDRVTLNAPKDRPHLQLNPDGNVIVIGGIPFDPRATPTPAQIPKLSDRPVPLPMEQSAATPSPIGQKTPSPKPTPHRSGSMKAPSSSHPSPSPTPVKID